MTTLFISDLHLSAERPQVTALLLDLLRRRAANADALYILGDFFEAWLGDDAVAPEYRVVLEALRRLTASGVPVHFQHGNRDFLVGNRYAEITGCTLLPENAVIDLYGVATLLMHGDTLCTDDREYQDFRAMVRDPAWQRRILNLSIPERIQLAKQLRTNSKAATAMKASEIMDANDEAVTKALQAHGVALLIHGHTHRPAIHRLSLGGRTATRIVLGDWDESPSILACDRNGCRLEDPRVTDVYADSPNA